MIAVEMAGRSSTTPRIRFSAYSGHMQSAADFEPHHKLVRQELIVEYPAGIESVPWKWVDVPKAPEAGASFR